MGLFAPNWRKGKGGHTNSSHNDRVSAVAWLCASAGSETTGINAEQTGKFPENK